jgi:hypothetical protein
VASALFPVQVLRIDVALVRRSGGAPHALLVGRELAFAGIAPSPSLQAVLILYSRGRRDRRRASARQSGRAGDCDRYEDNNGESREWNSVHDINSMRPGARDDRTSSYMCPGDGLHLGVAASSPVK